MSPVHSSGCTVSYRTSISRSSSNHSSLPSSRSFPGLRYIPLFGQLVPSSRNVLMTSEQCQYYGHKRSKTVAIAMYITAVVLFAGFEVGMIYAVRVRRTWGAFPHFRGSSIYSLQRMPETSPHSDSSVSSVLSSFP